MRACKCVCVCVRVSVCVCVSVSVVWVDNIGKYGMGECYVRVIRKYAREQSGVQ